MMDDVKRHVEIIRHCGNSKDGSACPECPFNLLDDEKDPCVNQLFRKSADLIESLAAELEQVKRERDAAVEDIRKAAWCCCHVCKHYYQPDPNTRIHSCKKYGDFDKHDFIADDGSIFCGAFEWRGVKE